jgi:menaquinone-dependent protoporphyrinogen oxidase
MRPIAVLYATREGQTQKIAEYLATSLGVRGLDVELHDVADGAPAGGLDSCSGVIVAASVHGGRHQAEMVRFVRDHVAELERLPSAFLSVSLSETGAEDPRRSDEERARFAADVRRMIDAFLSETGWHPARIKPVAGALAYSKYNFLLRFVMRRIARKAGADTDTSRDYEYTDWIDLDRFAARLAAELAAVPVAV